MPETALRTIARAVTVAARPWGSPPPAAVNISGRWYWHLRERERVFLSLDQTDGSISGHYNENVCGNHSTFGSLTGYVSGNVVLLDLEGFGAFSGTKYAAHQTMTGTLNGHAITFHEYTQDD
jgi:hypothetical protein